MPAALCAGRLSIMTISLRLRDNSARRSHAIAAKRGHKGDGLPMPLRHTANQALTARATTDQPHHLGIGGGLVNEDQWRDQTCPVLASSAGAPAPRPRALAPLRAGFFLKVIL